MIKLFWPAYLQEPDLKTIWTFKKVLDAQDLIKQFLKDVNQKALSNQQLDGAL